MKKTILALILALTFTIPVYANGTDDTDRLASNQNYTFSPGYLNAAKQQTENIINQEAPKKNAWEKAVDYVQSKLARQTAEGSNDKVDPNLQMRKSSQEKGSGQTADKLIDTINQFYSIDPNAAQKILDDSAQQGAAVTVLDNGNMVNVWRENNSTYFSIFDSQGKVLADKREITVAGDWNNVYAYNITDIGGGKFATIAYGYKYEYQSNTYSKSDYIYSLQVYSTNSSDAGNLVTQKNYGGNYYYDYKKNYYYGDSTYVGSLTSLGDGQYAMSVNKYSYRNDAAGYTYNSDSYVSITDSSLNIETGLKYTLNNYNSGNWNTGDYKYNYQYVNSITSLGSGTFALALGSYYYDQKTSDWGNGTNIKVMDNKFNTDSELYFAGYSYKQENGYYSYAGKNLSKVVSLGNGKFATAWSGYTSYYDSKTYNSSSTSSLFVEEFDSNMEMLKRYDVGNFTSSYSSNDYSKWSYGYISDMKLLDNGSLVLAINESSGNYNYKTSQYNYKSDAAVKIIGSDGETTDISLKGAMGDDSNKYISQLTVLGDGKFAVALRESKQNNSNQSISKNSVEQFSTAFKSNADKDSPSSSSASAKSDPLSSQSKDDAGNKTSSKGIQGQTSDKQNATKSDNNKSLLENDKIADATSSSSASSESLLRIMEDKNALSAYSIFLNAGSVDMLALLKNILNNPTEDQKNMLDTISALLSDIAKVKAETGDNTMLNEEADSMVKAATAALLAQALPDLLSSQDISGLKGIFQALGAAKSSIMKDYEAGTRPYYDQLLKDIAKNLNMLQLNNAISKSISKEELDNMPRNRIDIIIEKLKQKKNRSFEEEYILQQESKYRKVYLDPNKKMVEDKMKATLKDFTAKINGSLGGTVNQKK